MRKLARMLSKDLAIIAAVVGVVALTVSVLLVHLKNEFKIATIGYEMADATSTHRNLIEEHRRLKVESALLGRTDQIASEAQAHFKMETASPEQIEVLSEDDPKVATLLR